MGKKILYIVIIIILIIAGIFIAKEITKKDETKQTVANSLENTNKTNEENKVEENNIGVEPEENNVVENKVETGTTQDAPEEKAKQIAINNWGEDDTVYFSYDGKDEKGRYIICVREKTTTKALYWYYVDVETGAFDIE